MNEPKNLSRVSENKEEAKKTISKDNQNMPLKKTTCCACDDCTCEEGRCSCNTGDINCEPCKEFVVAAKSK